MFCFFLRNFVLSGWKRGKCVATQRWIGGVGGQGHPWYPFEAMVTMLVSTPLSLVTPGAVAPVNAVGAIGDCGHRRCHVLPVGLGDVCSLASIGV